MPNTSVTQLLTAIANSLSSIAGSRIQTTLIFPLEDYGDGWTQDIEGDLVLRGSVIDVHVYDVTEAFTATTTPARVDVGVAGGDLDAYSISGSLGTTGIGAAVHPAVTDGVTGIIPAGGSVTVSGIAPTGGTPAGIATTAVTIAWFV